MVGAYEGKTVLVTGGAGALGRAVAKAYQEAGALVIIADRLPPRDPNNTPFFTVDVLNEVSVSNLFSEISAQHGGPHALVNVVGGYAAGQPVSELDLEVWDSQMNLNLKSAFLLTKHAVKTMSAAGGGSIVHISSRAAVDKGVKSAAYSISKLGVLRLVEAVAEEAKAQNVTINAVMPSIIDTPANRAAMPKADVSKWPKPEEIAKVLLFLTSPDASLISGAAIPVYGKA